MNQSKKMIAKIDATDANSCPPPSFIPVCSFPQQLSVVLRSAFFGASLFERSCRLSMDSFLRSFFSLEQHEEHEG